MTHASRNGPAQDHQGTAMKKLTTRQQAILDYIGQFLDANDYPPTIRDIQGELGISSTSVVDYNLNVLEVNGYIRRNKNISRGLELLGREPITRARVVSIPVVGQIAAGRPIEVPESFSTQDVERTIEINASLVRGSSEGLFALRVKGLSMIDALINDGDIVILKSQQTCENGETVAVWLEAEHETTLKKFYLEGERVRLQPANMTMGPIYTAADNVRIMGKLVSVVRHID